MRKTRVLLMLGGLAVGLAAALAFAAISFAGANTGLAGTHWQLTEINGQPAVAGDVTPTLQFLPEDRLSGNGGCNGYGGAYTVNGSALQFSEMMSTLMACADDALTTQESAYFQALGSVASYALSGDTLTLKDASGAPVLVFARL
ncbi:MAG: META domain-containing protein [Anaerolineales bacterium]|nr:META domain-containing protein [Anaerolineales bacterium]